MRYASLFLSIIPLGIWVLTGSPTKAFASARSRYGGKAISDTSRIGMQSVTVDTVTTLERKGFGSVPQGRLQTAEVVTVSINSISNPPSAPMLIAEKLEDWSTIDLIER